jgi:hypothetical protein
MFSSRDLVVTCWMIAILPMIAETAGDVPRLTHVSQEELLTMSFDNVFIMGGRDFRTEFNRLDGFGDPARPDFNRIKGPDAQSCVACHHKVNGGRGHVPPLGGTGDIVNRGNPPP